MHQRVYGRGAAVYDAVGAVRTFPTPPCPLCAAAIEVLDNLSSHQLT